MISIAFILQPVPALTLYFSLAIAVLIASCGASQEGSQPQTGTPVQQFSTPVAQDNQLQTPSIQGLETTPTPTPTVTPEPESLPATIEELIKATQDPDWSVRWDAVNALGELKDPRGIPALVERALHDDNPHPRWRSLWALSSVDSSGQGAAPLLIPALQDSDLVVARNAAVALAFFGRPEARLELLRGLKYPANFRRWEAVFSLREVGSPEVVAALVPMLNPTNEPAEDVRAEVALALGHVGGKEVVPDLLKALQTDPSAGVRMRVALALPQVADVSVIGELEQALAVESDPQVRELLEGAVAELRKRK